VKKKFRSISWKILLTLISAILLLTGLVLIFNVLVIQRVRDEFIYEQIEDSMHSKRVIDEKRERSREHDETIWIAKFIVDFSHDNPKISMDKNTRVLYEEKYRSSTCFFDISEVIYADKEREKGHFRTDKANHYYIVEWNDNKSIATVNISSNKSKRIIGHELLFLIIIIILTCYVASIFVAKIISKPIQQLELFSEEIARKNWKAEPPEVNNDEIGLLAKALNRMKFDLKEAEEREHHFLQATSHDLKTPVMVIKGYAQAIIDDVKISSETPPAQIIIKESKRLERKINQLLHLNTIGNSLNSTKRETVRIDRIINNLVNRFRYIRPELKWIVDCSKVEIQGDSDSLVIALENLIDNQLRFSQTLIKISVKRTDRAIIKISNDGPAFNIDNPETLFDLYQKDKQGKFGLGLNIVKQVIDSHKGRISAENCESGVIFTIQI